MSAIPEKCYSRWVVWSCASVYSLWTKWWENPTFGDRWLELKFGFTAYWLVTLYS